MKACEMNNEDLKAAIVMLRAWTGCRVCNVDDMSWQQHVEEICHKYDVLNNQVKMLQEQNSIMSREEAMKAYGLIPVPKVEVRESGSGAVLVVNDNHVFQQGDVLANLLARLATALGLHDGGSS